jgi:esterase
MLDLHFKALGQGEPLIVLHGLFGMLDNWQTIGTELSERNMVYLVDQRNHGKSPHAPQMNYSLMAEDIVHLMNREGITSATILGHSMGGKTAMQTAIEFPDRVNKLIVADIAPKGYPPGHDEIFEALYSIDLAKVHYRSDAEDVLLQKIEDFGVRQFLLKNLQRNKDGTYSWKMNLDVLRDDYAHIRGPVSTDNYNGPSLFIRGERSGYILDEDWPAIQEQFPMAKLETIEDAGHWVHADQPDKLFNHVLRFMLL